MTLNEQINEAQQDYEFFTGLLKDIEAIENKTEGNKFAEKKCREMIANIEAFFNEIDYHTQITYD